MGDEGRRGKTCSFVNTGRTVVRKERDNHNGLCPFNTQCATGHLLFAPNNHVE